MIFFIASLITKFFPKLDIQRVQRYVLWAVLIVAGLVVLFLVIQIRSCFNKPPKLDLKEIQKAQQAIREQDRKEMVEILAESDVREAGITNSIKAAEEATEKSKRNYNQLSNDELAAELERRSKE